MVDHSQFEAIKVAIKQDKTGYVLTLAIHPDEVPEEILRDFVGARYQVVMVRIDDDEKPVKRPANGVVAAAGILCRNKTFWEWLHDLGEIETKSERDAVEALHRLLGISSRSELTQPSKQSGYDELVAEYNAWVRINNIPPF